MRSCLVVAASALISVVAAGAEPGAPLSSTAVAPWPGSGTARGRLQHVGWLGGDAAVSLALLGQVNEPTLTPAPINGLNRMTRWQLFQERDRLRDDLPGLGGPIWLMVGGAGTIAAGVFYLINVFTLGSIAFPVGAVLVVAGIAAIGGGILWMINRLRTRAELLDQIEKVDRRLGELGPALPEVPEWTSPPAPPPGVQLPPPAPQWMLARF